MEHRHYWEFPEELIKIGLAYFCRTEQKWGFKNIILRGFSQEGKGERDEGGREMEHVK